MEELKSLVLYPIGLALGTYIIAENDEGVYYKAIQTVEVLFEQYNEQRIREGDVIIFTSDKATHLYVLFSRTITFAVIQSDSDIK